MAKIRTLSHLQDELDAEMVWRIKEISDFKIAAKDKASTSRTFIRAGVALVYAHWEGFIKAASESYLNFVENQGHNYRDLKTCFAVFGLKSKLALLDASRKAKPNIEALDFVIGELDKPARMGMSSAINTDSNLTSQVFVNIATSLDISIAPYETKFKLIDESLVERRNKVAHGEFIDLSLDDFLTLSDDVLQLMRWYKTDIENAASLANYKRTSVVSPFFSSTV
jgi:MAE_28990/MAE_18760-like HEPN